MPMVLGWAGMRGVMTLAVALSVPEGFPGRDFILVAAFVAILVTVLVQGTTLGAVIRWVRPGEVATDRPRLTMSQVESVIAQAELMLVERRAYDPDGTLIHPLLPDHYRRKAAHLAEYADRVEDYGPTLHAHFNLVLDAITAGRIELPRLHRSGQIDEETLQELERDLDLEELSARSNLVWIAGRTGRDGGLSVPRRVPEGDYLLGRPLVERCRRHGRVPGDWRTVGMEGRMVIRHERRPPIAAIRRTMATEAPSAKSIAPSPC